MLLRVRDYLAAIVENSADAIVTAGRIISWNRGAEELYGHAAEVSRRSRRRSAESGWIG